MAVFNVVRRLTLFPVLALLLCQKSLAEPIMQSGMMDGQQRTWRIFVPSSNNTDSPMPLVFNFHGTSSNPEEISALNQLEVLAEQETFIVVAPQAAFSYEPEGPKTWNVEQLNSPYNDIAFVKALIAQLQQDYSIDTRRIYATGFSGGARMSSRLACDMADTFAAVAPIAGVRYGENCAPVKPMPVITYHGTQDPVNHYTHKTDSPRYWREGVEPAIDGWVSHNQCQSAKTKTLQPGLTKTTWSACHDDVNVVFIRSLQGGHTWPGSPMAKQLAKYGLGATDNLPMTSLVWTFLKQYQRNQ